MQLKLMTDHAICTLLYMAKTKDVCTAQEISREMHISLNYLRFAIVALRDAGLIETLNGKIGSCRLAKASDQITLYDVATTTEDTIKISRCLERDDSAGFCPAGKCYQSIQTTLEDKLKSITIADLLKQMM